MPLPFYSLSSSSHGLVLMLLLLLLSHFSRVRPHRWQPTRLPCPWDSLGKNTGVGCHVLLQCRKVKSEGEVAELCLTPSDPMDCSLPGSSIHGICQARVLEWGAIAFSRIPFFLKNGWLSFCVVLAPLNTLFFVSNILLMCQGHFEFWCNLLANGYPLSEIFRSFYHPGLQ